MFRFLLHPWHKGEIVRKLLVDTQMLQPHRAITDLGLDLVRGEVFVRNVFASP